LAIAGLVDRQPSILDDLRGASPAAAGGSGAIILTVGSIPLLTVPFIGQVPTG
jgi:hypothetical protein